MFIPKEEVFKALSELGYYCLQGSQDIFTEKQLPAITFNVMNNTVNVDLDNDIASQDVTIGVDIWADSSKEISTILPRVEETMRALKYKMSFSADISPQKGALYHTNCRFDTLR